MSLLARLYPGDAVVLWAASVLVQVAVAVTLAYVLSWACARHRAALRHGIWLSALGCVLLGPMAAYVTERAGVSWLSLRLLPHSLSTELKIDQQTADEARPAPVEVKAAQPRDCEARAALGAVESAEKARPQEYSAADGIRAVLALATMIWVAGTALFLARLLYGWWALARLQRCLQPVDANRLSGALAEVRRILKRDDLPPLAAWPAEAERTGPITIGVLHPRVVLPEGLLKALEPPRLRDVLVHEFAHVLRRDPLVGLLQRLAAAVYWPYPPVHLLNRRLAWAREEVCDNYVLRQGDAPSYAETLLAISESIMSKRPRPAALGLLHPRLRLEQRVAGLVDPRRNVMVRMHRITLAVLIGVFLTVLVAVAGTRLLRAEPPAASDAPAASTSSIQRRAVDKLIKDFPEKTDLSTPESAQAAWSRATARKDVRAIVQLSWRPLDPTAEEEWFAAEERRDREGLPIYLKAVAESRVIEVQMYRRELANVISLLPFPPGKGRHPYSSRFFGKIDGVWKNLGEDRLPSVEAARDNFDRNKDFAWQEFTALKRDVITRQKPPAPQMLSEAPYRIEPLDVLTIRVLGTLPDYPINGNYLVEPDGQLTLGPSYGRLNLKGLTFEQAEDKIKQHLKDVLSQPEVQVEMAGKAGKWRPYVPRVPYTIGRGDLLLISVAGTIKDQPINNVFRVEQMGTIALGPGYGRVQVRGLKLEDAEKAIQEQLKKILSQPEVSVTLAGWKLQDQDWLP